MVSQSMYGVSLKLSAMFRYCYLQSCHEKIYQRNRHTGYCRKTRCWHHHTIRVQGIRNDDQSLSPVTPLVCLLFLSFEMFRNIFNLLVYICSVTMLYAARLINRMAVCPVDQSAVPMLNQGPVDQLAANKGSVEWSG